MTFVTPPSPSSQYNCSGKLAASFRLLKASYFWFFCRSCFEAFTFFNSLVFVYCVNKNGRPSSPTFTNPRNIIARASWPQAGRLLKASRFWLFCRSCFKAFTLFDCNIHNKLQKLLRLLFL